MKTIISLSGCVGPDREHFDPRGVVRTIADEPKRGFFRALSLGGAGLVARQGRCEIMIPLDELWRLIERAEPAFVPTDAPRPGLNPLTPGH